MPSHALRCTEYTSSFANVAVTTSLQDGPADLIYEKFWRAYDSDPDKHWRKEVESRLEGYTQMQHGWDTYDAPPPRSEAVFFALSIIHELESSRLIRPHIVPSSAGGIQLEWHTNDLDIELHVEAPYLSELWWRRHSNGEEESAELTNDFSALSQILKVATR